MTSDKMSYKALKVLGTTAAFAAVPGIARAQAYENPNGYTNYKEDIELNASVYPEDARLISHTKADWIKDRIDSHPTASSRITGLYGDGRVRVMGSLGGYLDDDLDMHPEWDAGIVGSAALKNVYASGVVKIGGKDRWLPTDVRAYGNMIFDIGSGNKRRKCNNLKDPRAKRQLSFGLYPGMERDQNGKWVRDLPVEAALNLDGIMYGVTYRFIEDASSELGFKIQFLNFQNSVAGIGMTTTTDNVGSFFTGSEGNDGGNAGRAPYNANAFIKLYMDYKSEFLDKFKNWFSGK